MTAQTMTAPAAPAADFDPEECARRGCTDPADETAPEPYDRYCSEGCHDDDAHAAEQRRIRDALFLMGEASHR